MEKQVTISFEQFKRDAECASLDREQAEAFAYVASFWFGNGADEQLLQYWDEMNND